MNNLSVVDLFCGVGGLTHGLIKEGFNVLAGIDSDPSCEYAFEANNPNSNFVNKKIEDVKISEIKSWYEKDSPKILVGCAPCQPFSSYTNHLPKDKKKWGLLYQFLEIIEQVKPEIVSMENVTRLQSFKKGKVLNDFVHNLKELGYFVSVNSVYCPDYDIPQSRTRLVLLASRIKEIHLTSKFRLPSEYRTVRQTIEYLPEIKAGQQYTGDRLHVSSSLSPLNLERIQVSTPGGSWKQWPDRLIASCHKKESGQSYPSVYGRMKWDEPSPTMTTQFYGFGNGRFGHPTQNRAISLREGALFQTFPKDYDFVESNKKVHIKIIGRHIGNAVPVQLGKVIGQSIKQHLED